MPLAVFEEVNLFGDCHLENFMHFKERITEGRAMDVTCYFSGEFNSAINANWCGEQCVHEVDAVDV